jgi:hypothetical protein
VSSSKWTGEFCSVDGVGLTLEDVERVPEDVVTAVSMSEKGSREWGLVRLRLAVVLKEAA